MYNRESNPPDSDHSRRGSSPSSKPVNNLPLKEFIPQQKRSLQDISPEVLRIPAKTPVRITVPDGPQRLEGAPPDATRHVELSAISHPNRYPNSPIIHMNSNYYFPDGSVILQLKKVQFRVHPHLIGRQSENLAKLFAEEQPAHARLIDGCKLFLLPGDPKDFETLLGVLYDSFTHISQSQPFCFDFVAQILRASTVHSFPSLRQWAIQELRRAYPHDIDRFDPENTTFCVERVTLARQCGINWLAKTGLYHAASLKELGVRAREREGAWDSDEGDEDDALSDENRQGQQDISFETSFSSVTSVPNPTCPPGNKYELPDSTKPNSLPLSDLQLVIRLLEKFQKSWIYMARPPTPSCPGDLITAASEPSSSLSVSPTCAQVFAAVWSTHILPYKPEQSLISDSNAIETRATIFAAGFYNPLKGFQTLSKIEWEKLGVCEACARSARDDWVREAKELWYAMDRWLELEPDVE